MKRDKERGDDTRRVERKKKKKIKNCGERCRNVENALRLRELAAKAIKKKEGYKISIQG